MKTTLNEIRDHRPCQPSWEKLLKALGKTQADDEPLAFRTIYNMLGADDLLWCSCVLPKKDGVALGLKFAEDVAHLTTDKRVHDCLDVCRRYLKGEATEEELRAAAAAAAAYATADADADAYAAYAAAAAAYAYAAYAYVYAAAAYAAYEKYAQWMLDYVEGK